MSHQPGVQLLIGELVEGVVDADSLGRALRIIGIASPVLPAVEPLHGPRDAQLAVGQCLVQELF